MSELDQTGGEVLTDDTALEVEGTDEQSAFFEYGEGDNALRFTTPDELKSHLDKSINFERDYTRKSQQREQEYRTKQEEFAKQQQAFEKSQETWKTDVKGKYDKYDEMLTKRPAIAQELARLADKPITPDEMFTRSQGYADEKVTALQDKLDAIESRFEQEQLEKQTEGIYAELEKEYPDFNREAVKEALGKLDGNDTKGLIEMLYLANRPNTSELREKVEQDIAKKSGSGMLPTGGGSPPKKTSGSTDPKVARQEAYEWATGG